MAKTQLILATLFVSLALSLEIPSIEGRHLKFGKKDEIPKLESHSSVSQKENKQVVAGKSISKTVYANEAVPAAPTTPIPLSQLIVVQMEGRKMEPGKKFQGVNPEKMIAKDIISTQINVSFPSGAGHGFQTMEGHVDDFQPATPRHSPGIGQAIHN